MISNHGAFLFFSKLNKRVSLKFRSYVWKEGFKIKVQVQFRKIIREAIQSEVSDIYVLPFNDRYLIRFRSKFGLKKIGLISSSAGQRFLNYCKFHSGMVISEHRRPQLGALKVNSTCFLRLSTVGDYNGRESLVIRIIKGIDRDTIHFLDPKQFQQITRLAPRRGLILFAGPTGSGKTTTIYYLAKQFSQKKMVMSIEDPVEIHEKSFLQLQVNREAGMDYSDLLKVGLRHRPDVFIIGEIRDHQTASATIQAALSGHLVLSTVHAQSPLGVINRMRQLGIDEVYLRQSLNSVVYQRLLPQSNHQLGAFLTIMTAKQFWPQNAKDQSLDGWRKQLSELVKNKKISPAVYQKYKFG